MVPLGQRRVLGSEVGRNSRKVQLSPLRFGTVKMPSTRRSLAFMQAASPWPSAGTARWRRRRRGSEQSWRGTAAVWRVGGGLKDCPLGAVRESMRWPALLFPRRMQWEGLGAALAVPPNLMRRRMIHMLPFAVPPTLSPMATVALRLPQRRRRSEAEAEAVQLLPSPLDHSHRRRTIMPPLLRSPLRRRRMVAGTRTRPSR